MVLVPGARAGTLLLRGPRSSGVCPPQACGPCPAVRRNGQQHAGRCPVGWSNSSQALNPGGPVLRVPHAHAWTIELSQQAGRATNPTHHHPDEFALRAERIAAARMGPPSQEEGGGQLLADRAAAPAPVFLKARRTPTRTSCWKHARRSFRMRSKSWPCRVAVLWRRTAG